MKRVLLAVHKFFPEHRAGTEVLTLKVAQELEHRGYETLVVTANPPDRDARSKDGPETSTYEYEGIRVIALEEPLRLKDNQFSSEFYNPAIREHFKPILRRFAPDMVHIFHAQNLSASIINESLAQKLPIIISATDFWFICPIVQLKRPDGQICRGPSALATNCLTCYTPALFPPLGEFREALAKQSPAFTAAYNKLPAGAATLSTQISYAAYIASKLPGAVAATMQRPGILRDAANHASAITVPTILMKDLFIENGIDSRLLHHVPFGIDVAPLEIFQNKSKSETLRIGFIGTLYEHKGVDLLIQAFLRLPSEANVRLEIYGDTEQFPDYVAGLMKLTNNGSANCSKIAFKGTFPNSQLGQVLSEQDVLVVPSRWYENTPLVIQSALATKTPVIATNLGGMSELVHHNVNGLLFQLNDAGSLTIQLLRLINEPGLLQKLVAHIKPERTTQEMVDQLESIYAEVSNH